MKERRKERKSHETGPFFIPLEMSLSAHVLTGTNSPNSLAQAQGGAHGRRHKWAHTHWRRTRRARATGNCGRSKVAGEENRIALYLLPRPLVLLSFIMYL